MASGRWRWRRWWGVQWWRIASGCEARGLERRAARAYALFVLVAKPAQLQGALQFLTSLIAGRERHLIEYKGVPGDGVG